MDTAPGEITRVLARVGQGDAAANAELAPLVYREMRRMARAYLAAERRDHTLQPTALVHEAWLRLIGSGALPTSGRQAFFAAAAKAMRRVLVDHARARLARKRGGRMERIELDLVPITTTVSSAEILDVDRALTKLAQLHQRQSDIVELHFFGGMNFDEIGEVLGVSTKTVQRDWVVARAFLRAEVRPDSVARPAAP